MNQRSRAAVQMIAASLVGSAILAALPLWTTSRVVKADRISAIVYEGGPIWEADFVQDSWVRERNWIQAGFWTSAVTLVGLIAYRRRVAKLRPDQSDDYEEKADGSMPDGRALPGAAAKHLKSANE
jgi:hypothetical protein